MVDRNKVKALASYKEIVSQGYNDVSGKIQVKKGAFQFDKKPIEYSAYWHEAYRTYIITSAGTVRALKGPASHVIANVDLNSLSSYDKGLKAILVDIEEFEGKIKRRQELSKGREDYLQTILDKPLVVKKRIVSVFFIKWI
jgi:hypothetical protein